MAKLKENLQQLEQEYSFITKSSKNKNKIHIASNQAKLKGYQDTVKQLEQRLDQITKEKEELITKNYHLVKNIEQYKNMISTTREEIVTRCIIRAEFIAENEQAEEELDILREMVVENFNSQELQDYFEGSKNLKQEQENSKTMIKEIDYKIQKLRKDKQEHEKNVNKITHEVEKFYASFINKEEEEEIENFEHLIKETCENLNLEYMENIILSLNALDSFDIDEEILKFQLLKVEKEEKCLKDA